MKLSKMLKKRMSFLALVMAFALMVPNVQVAAAGTNLILNGDFNTPGGFSSYKQFDQNKSPVTPWLTNDFGNYRDTGIPGSYLEIWNDECLNVNSWKLVESGDSYNLVKDKNGYFCEINATNNLNDKSQLSTIFQYVTLEPGQWYKWAFSHRGRNGSDQADVFIGNNAVEKEIKTAKYDKKNISVETYNVIAANTKSVAYNKDGSSVAIKTGTNGWSIYNGYFQVPADYDDETIFGIRCISTKGDSMKQGNFIDNIILEKVSSNTVEYDLNGAPATSNTVISNYNTGGTNSYLPDTALKIIANPVWPGHKFLGWDCTALESIDQKFNASFNTPNPGKDITWVAKWQKLDTEGNCKIIYDANGHPAAADDFSDFCDYDVNSPDDFSADILGYQWDANPEWRFIGWSDVSEDSFAKVNEGDAIDWDEFKGFSTYDEDDSDQDNLKYQITLYAIYEQRFPVKYDPNGGSNPPTDVNFYTANDPDDLVTVQSGNSMTPPEGYYFTGWSLHIVDPDHIVTDPTEWEADSHGAVIMTFVANWAKIQCTINYFNSPTDFEEPTYSDSVDYGENYDVDGEKSPGGSDFLYWVDNEGKIYHPNYEIEGVISDIDLYAVYATAPVVEKAVSRSEAKPGDTVTATVTVKNENMVDVIFDKIKDAVSVDGSVFGSPIEVPSTKYTIEIVDADGEPVEPVDEDESIVIPAGGKATITFDFVIPTTAKSSHKDIATVTVIYIPGNDKEPVPVTGTSEEVEVKVKVLVTPTPEDDPDDRPRRTPRPDTTPEPTPTATPTATPTPEPEIVVVPVDPAPQGTPVPVVTETPGVIITQETPPAGEPTVVNTPEPGVKVNPKTWADSASSANAVILCSLLLSVYACVLLVMKKRNGKRKKFYF